MIVNLNNLKQRFMTGEVPAANDFGDLIDTLAALNSGVAKASLDLSVFASLTANAVLQTDGSGNVIAAALSLGAASGDGSISGSYPAISVAAGGIQTTHVANGAITPAKLNTSAASVAGPGSVLAWNGTAIGWQSPSAISAQTRTINRVLAYSTTPSAFTVVSTVVSTQTIANAQGVIPSSMFVSLLCTATDGTHNVGDQIPIEDVTSASFEPAFSCTVNTSNFIVVANCASTAMQIGGTGITLANWKLAINAVINVPNAPVTAPSALQMHNVRAAVSYNGVLYVGHVLPTDQSGSTYPTSTSPVKTFGYDSTGYAVATSYFSSINLNNGNVLIGAGVSGGTPFPTSDFSTAYGKNSGCYNTFGMAQLNAVAWPTGGYNAIMWIRGNDTFFTGPQALGNSTLLLGTVSVPKGNGAISSVRLDTLALSAITGPTESAVNPPFYNVWGTLSGTPQTYHTYPQHLAIVQVDDTVTNPDFYVIGSQYFPSVLPGIQMTMNNCAFGRYSYIGGVYKFVGPAAGGTPSTNPAGAINWLNSSIAIAAGQTTRNTDIFAGSSALNPIYFVMVRYNPVKRRFYVIDALTGLLHIFTLSESLVTWLGTSYTAGNTGNALDYTQLTYNGSFAIPAGPAHFETVAYEDIGTAFGSPSMRDMWTVEFDLTSGAEYALVVTRGLQNTVTRIPWIWI